MGLRSRPGVAFAALLTATWLVAAHDAAADCRNDGTCEGGRCVRLASGEWSCLRAFCRADCECRRDERCLRGRCRRAVVIDVCRSSLECGDGESCIHGFCVDLGVILDLCKHVECPEGMRCHEGACGGRDFEPLCSRMRCPPDSFCANGACIPLGGFDVGPIPPLPGPGPDPIPGKPMREGPQPEMRE